MTADERPARAERVGRRKEQRKWGKEKKGEGAASEDGGTRKKRENVDECANDQTGRQAEGVFAMAVVGHLSWPRLPGEGDRTQRKCK
jgi:hypothetical protein